MIINKILKTRRHLNEKGFVATVRWAFTGAFYKPVTRWLDNSFDRKYGTDTSKTVHLSEFDVDAENLEHARNYQATPDRTFLRFLAQQKLNYSSYTFIDLGCGKGRTLLLASQLPFKKIVGIELDSSIHAICEKNITTYFSNTKFIQRPMEALCMSAGEFDFPTGNIFIYLFNPFDDHIMMQVADNLRKTIESEYRYIRIVYFNPKNVGPLLSLPKITLIREETFRSRAMANNIGRMVTYEITP